MTFVLLLVVAGIALVASSVRTRARERGSGAYRLLLGPAFIVLGVLTLPFVLASRLFFGIGIAIVAVGALGAALSRKP